VKRRSGAEAMLTAGDASGCGEPEKSTDTSIKGAAAVAQRLPPKSTLSQQNDLLKHGLAAEHRGDLARAEADLGRLLARYPDSPFTAEAQRALARVRAKRLAP
jgi:TolA-binding protein